jgi:uncharacterized protein
MGCAAQTSFAAARSTPVIDARVAARDWAAVQAGLDEHGVACVPGLLNSQECAAMTELYTQEGGFRSRVVMARHGYGRGEYRYFSYPLPPLVGSLRAALYPRLVPTANRWNELMRLAPRYPEDHAAYLQRCHAAGQMQPTPLLLRYGPGDYNCLHQDIYGEHHFPLQAAILLSEPGRDFDGGEFVLTEQRPRAQSRVEVLTPHQGDLVIFAVRDRPAKGIRGFFRVKHRHGVSLVRAGGRHTLGIIFHDAV